MAHFIKSLLAACMVIVCSDANAQILKKIQKKLEDKAEKKIDEVINEKDTDTSVSTTSSTVAGLPSLEDVFSFTPGSRVIFVDDLSQNRTGNMPRYWQTNSTGSVATVAGVEGQWLKLAANASYQLDTLLDLPRKFTLEFDLLTRADNAEDIRNFDFGFSRSNTTRSYIYGVSNDETSMTTSLMFYYDAVSTSSSDTKNDSKLDFPLRNFANARIHVAIAVDGERMQVYLNKSKVLDAIVFNPGTPKHFYISTERWRNNAAVYVGNLRIME